MPYREGPNEKIPKPLHESGRCHFCGKELGRKHYCHGCGAFICDACDKSAGNLWGNHSADDHGEESEGES